MEVVTCYCKKCDSEVARLRNSWNGIGNSYFSPAYPPLSIDGMKVTGEIFEGASDSQIKDSLLEDLACENCGAVLGLCCEKAPDGHLLKKNQLILRLADMSVLSEASGQKAKISVLKSFPLTLAPGLRRVPSAKLLSRPSPRIGKPSSSATPSRAPTEPTHVSSPPTSVSYMVKFKTWAEDAIENQQKAIDRLSGTLDRLEREVKSFKEFMNEVRSEIASGRQPRVHDDQDIINLRAELDELRQKVNRSGGLMSRGSLEFPIQKLDVVAQDVQQISQKAAEVDVLRTELKEMQSQVRRLEATQQSVAARTTSSHSGQSLTPTELHKRKHDGHEKGASILEVQVLDGHSTKRRKVSSPLPSKGHNTEAGHRQTRCQTPDQQLIEVNSSSDHTLSPNMGREAENKALDGQHRRLSAGPGARDPLTPLARPSTDQPQTTTDPKPADEDNDSALHPKVMSLPKGTILDAENRSKIFEFSHIEVGTGRKRDAFGRWVTPKGKIDKRSLRYRKEETKGPPKPVFADKQVVEREQVIRRSLRPRNDRPIISIEIESYDSRVGESSSRRREGSAQEIMRDPNPEESTPGESSPKVPGFTSMAAYARADREHTLPPIQVDEACDPNNLPQFFKCGTCGKKYRTLQSLDYHQDHNPECKKGPSDEVPEAFKCGACGKLFKSVAGIEHHMKHKPCESTPGKSKPDPPALLKCERCGRRWKGQEQLQQHACVSRKTGRQTLTEKEAELAAREAAVAKRERLVRETLEREMTSQ